MKTTKRYFWLELKENLRKLGFRKKIQKTTMTTPVLRNKVLVLCDHDALYSAIEIKLCELPWVSIKRSALNLFELTNAMTLSADADLIILATVAPITDLAPALMDLLSNSQIKPPPVMMISEHLFVPELGERITFLNFPFDIDALSLSVTKILGGDPLVKP